MNRIINVLVVDDSAFMRTALVKMIERNPGFKVVGTANDGKEGVAQALKLSPDVVTMDIEMPVMNGLEALREIMRRKPMPVVMVSTLTEAGAAATLEAIDAGAVDFIPKSLADKNKNIFQNADAIHDKLFAAASARVAGGTTAAQPLAPQVAAQPLAPQVAAAAKVHSSVERVSARVLVIGSSTGGPKALQELLSHLPASFPVPIVVAQHLPPLFTAALAQRLDEASRLHVVEATDGARMANGHVYIAPGGQQLRVSAAGTLSVRASTGESPYTPSIDVLTESANQAFGKQVLALILSGAGADGLRGVKQLRQQGAHVIVQDAETSLVYGIGRAVVEANLANEVLAMPAIAPRLLKLLGS